MWIEERLDYWTPEVSVQDSQISQIFRFNGLIGVGVCHILRQSEFLQRVVWETW